MTPLETQSQNKLTCYAANAHMGQQSRGAKLRQLRCRQLRLRLFQQAKAGVAANCTCAHCLIHLGVPFATVRMASDLTRAAVLGRMPCHCSNQVGQASLLATAAALALRMMAPYATVQRLQLTIINCRFQLEALQPVSNASLKGDAPGLRPFMAVSSLLAMSM